MRGASLRPDFKSARTRMRRKTYDSSHTSKAQESLVLFQVLPSSVLSRPGVAPSRLLNQMDPSSNAVGVITTQYNLPPVSVGCSLEAIFVAFTAGVVQSYLSLATVHSSRAAPLS